MTGILLLVVINFPYQNLGGVRVNVSSRTTNLLGPLTDNGTVDYAAAINQRQMEGVTTENNVVAAIFRLTPGQFFGKIVPPQKPSLRDRFAKALGYEITPEALVLQDPEQVFRDRIKEAIKDPDRVEEINSELQKFRVATETLWKSEAFPECAALLKSQEETIDLIREAASRTRYYHPILLNPIEGDAVTIMNAVLPVGQRFRQCARILVLRALNALGDGSTEDIESAVADLKAARRLGWLQCQSVSLIEKLIASAIYRNVSLAEAELLACQKLTSRQLQDYQAFVKQHPYPIDIANRIDFGERLTLLDQAQAMLLDPKALGLNLGINQRSPIEQSLIQSTLGTSDINSTLEAINYWFDQYRHALRQTNLLLVLEDLDELENRLAGSAETGSYLAMLLEILRGPKSRGRYLGNVLTAMFLPAGAYAARADFDTHTLSLLSEVAFAIANFQSQHGRLPESLDELTPEFIQQAPIDPYQQTAFKFICRDGGFIVYSVGPDGVDNGGREVNEVEKNEEYDIRLAVKIRPEIEKGSLEDRRTQKAESERRYWNRLKEQKTKKSSQRAASAS